MPDSNNDQYRRSPMPMDGVADADARRGTWLDRLVPRPLVIAALTVEIRAPETIRLGEQTSFYVVVRNRVPVPVTVSTPTSRLWGWTVDGIKEADRRSFSPPETGRGVRFSGLERKEFEATWDGRICEERNGEMVWSDTTGTHTLTGYLAVEGWEEHGLSADAEVTVTDGEERSPNDTSPADADKSPHQE